MKNFCGMVSSMRDRNLLFIVEGESDEPAFIRRLFQTCYRRQGYKTYTYKTNLHNLANHLERDYPDFDDGDIDICLILRSHDSLPEHRKILKEKYTDIFLVFDFEPQQDYPRFETIRKMLNVFNDSTDCGKLFINYPMMQSYKHFCSLPDNQFYKVTVSIDDCKKYKQLVGRISGYTDITHYTYQIFVSITAHHLKKAQYLLTGRFELPDIDEYLSWMQTQIFDKQMQMKAQCGCVSVLNTCVFILIDYNPSSFFRQLKDRKSQFLIEL